MKNLEVWKYAPAERNGETESFCVFLFSFLIVGLSFHLHLTNSLCILNVTVDFLFLFHSVLAAVLHGRITIHPNSITENIRDSAPTEQEWWDDDTVLHPGAGRVSCGGGVMFKAISTGVASGDGCSSDVNTTMLTAADISYEGDEREGEAEAGAEAPVSDFHAMITNPIASTMAAFFSSSTEPSSQPQARPSTDRSSEQRSQEHDPQSHQRTTTLTRTKRFHNVGLETWLRVREEWKQRTVVTLPPRPTPAEHAQLVRSLKRHSTLRTYELPRRMVLSDLIAVYQDIWDSGEL